MSRHSGTEGYSRSGSWLVDIVTRNPEGLLLVAAGCALMMRAGGASRRRERRTSGDRNQSAAYDSARSGADSTWKGERVSKTAERASEYASDIKETISEAAASYASSVGETATSYASSAADYASSAGRGVSDYSGGMARQAHSTIQDTIQRVVRDQPLAVALVGLAAGAAVAAAFPTTDIERRTLREAAEKLATKARDHLREGAAKAGERLMSSVAEHGLNADGLKEVVRDVAGRSAVRSQVISRTREARPVSPTVLPVRPLNRASQVVTSRPGPAQHSEGLDIRTAGMPKTGGAPR